jgi:aryl sulfotransferase
MIVLQNGMPRSGNFWVYTIIQKILTIGGHKKRSFIKQEKIYQNAKSWPYFNHQAHIDYLEITDKGFFYRKGNFQAQIKDICDYLQQTNHVWSHSHWSNLTNEVLDHVDKIVYIVRDPRDVAVSSSQFVFTPLMLQNHPHGEKSPEAYLKNRLYEIILGWVNHVGNHLLKKREYPFIFIFFERLKYDFNNEVQKLGKHLGVLLEEYHIKEIKESVDFSLMKTMNPYHLRKGTSGDWINALDKTQRLQVAKISGPMLSVLNYPIEEPLKHNLPCITTTDQEIIRKAIEISRGSLFDKLLYSYYWFKSARPLDEKIKKGISFLLQLERWGMGFNE